MNEIDQDVTEEEEKEKEDMEEENVEEKEKEDEDSSANRQMVNVHFRDRFLLEVGAIFCHNTVLYTVGNE